MQLVTTLSKIHPTGFLRRQERLEVTQILEHHSRFLKPCRADFSSGNRITFLMRMEMQTSFPWLIRKWRSQCPGASPGFS